MNRIFNYTPVIAAIILLGGCLSYTPPPVETESDTYTQRQKDPRVVLPANTKMLTLETAQRLAIANNPDFEAQYHAVQAAWDAYRQYFSAYMPTVTANYSFSQNLDKPTDMTNVTRNDTNNMTNQVGMSASLLVFNGLQREMNLLMAKHQALGEEAVRENARRLLLKAVAEAYNNILLAIENNRIAISDRKFQFKQLEDAQCKYELGAVPLSDVLNFKIKVN
ncbi:MAG: TolC family protein, partial [Victivallales bacterium]|nr:TolC family protein [Victivallales bacterium]